MTAHTNVNLGDSLAVGEYGVLYSGSTNKISASTGFVIFRIDVLVAATLTSINADASAPITGDFTGVAIPAGMSIYGKFTDFTLTSGKVLAYQKPLQA